MKHDAYSYLADTLAGRRARDPEFEAQLKDVADPRAEERQRQLDAKTAEERELEQRQYSLRTYGREHMKRYASAIVSDKALGELGIEGDQIRNTSRVKGHSGEERSWRDANGRLKLQFHEGEPGCYLQKV